MQTYRIRVEWVSPFRKPRKRPKPRFNRRERAKREDRVRLSSPQPWTKVCPGQYRCLPTEKGRQEARIEWRALMARINDAVEKGK